MNGFVAGDRAPSSPEGAEMLAGVDPPLDGAVAVFNFAEAIAKPLLNSRTATLPMLCGAFSYDPTATEIQKKAAKPPV